MAVYPFYIDSDVYGKASHIKGGCRNKDGYQTTAILQRDKGKSKTIFTVVQTSHYHPETGEIILLCQVYNKDGEVVAREETVY